MTVTRTQTFRPMLASKPKNPLTGDFRKDFHPNNYWVFEPKFDGVRCIAMNGRLWSRSGNDITDRFPEIPADAFKGYILDGEVIMHDEHGLPKFNTVQNRSAANARSQIDRGNTATYMVFDVLQEPGSGLMYNELLIARRQRLEGIFLPRHTLIVPQLSGIEDPFAGQLMWDAARSAGHEGVMAKHVKGRYHEGNRTPDWVKVKKTMTVSCVVGGIEPGKGSRSSTFGALLLYLRDGSDVIPVGKAGTGFKEADLAYLMTLLDKGQPFVVEVQCMEVTKNKQLRFPVYQGVRDDISILDCTIDQLA